MVPNIFEKNLIKLIENYNFKGDKKYKLVILFGLLGDFDSFEYAINLKKFIISNQNADLNIFAIGMAIKKEKKNFVNIQVFRKKI